VVNLGLGLVLVLVLGLGLVSWVVNFSTSAHFSEALHLHQSIKCYQHNSPAYLRGASWLLGRIDSGAN